MKRFFFRIGLFTSMLLLFANCSSTKAGKAVPVAKTEAVSESAVPVDETAYIPKQKKNFFPETEAETHWVDSIYNQMTFDEKVGQLFMVAAYSNKDAAHFADIDKL